jgi:hypothetical protein
VVRRPAVSRDPSDVPACGERSTWWCAGLRCLETLRAAAPPLRISFFNFSGQAENGSKGVDLKSVVKLQLWLKKT